MTIKYTDKVASRRGFGCFFRLLTKWRGSVYKMIWQDMLAYILLYYLINFTYRFALNDYHKKNFENFVVHCGKFTNLIPISFVLGFYVSLVVSRWWGTYNSIPWPDSLAITVGNYIPGNDIESKKVRELVMRYANLTIATTLSMISPPVKEKLPTDQHFVVHGYLTENERAILENMNEKNKQHKTWVPISWACKTLVKAREQGILTSDSHERMIRGELMFIRGNCGGLLGWAEYNIPLVYTQVVTIAVYSFFIFSLIGNQLLEPSQDPLSRDIDIYIPIFALLQIFFYIGWIKVAEALLNPFGCDDHDWEFCGMLSRHLEMSALLSDMEQCDLPPHLQDTDEKTQDTDEKTVPVITQVEQ